MTPQTATHAQGSPTRPVPALRIQTYTPRDLSGTKKPRRWRAPGRKKFDPKPGHVGSTVVFEANGVRQTGQVWALGPKRGEVWVVKDGITYLVAP